LAQLLHGTGPGLDHGHQGLRGQRGEHEARQERSPRPPRLHGSCCWVLLTPLLLCEVLHCGLWSGGVVGARWAGSAWAINNGSRSYQTVAPWRIEGERREFTTQRVVGEGIQCIDRWMIIRPTVRVLACWLWCERPVWIRFLELTHEPYLDFPLIILVASQVGVLRWLSDMSATFRVRWFLSTSQLRSLSKYTCRFIYYRVYVRYACVVVCIRTYIYLDERLKKKT